MQITNEYIVGFTGPNKICVNLGLFHFAKVKIKSRIR